MLCLPVIILTLKSGPLVQWVIVNCTVFRLALVFLLLLE
eukprot:COSAG02_NODE_40883_length_400_cov_1.019934_1_plen_38_part_01